MPSATQWPRLQRPRSSPCLLFAANSKIICCIRKDSPTRRAAASKSEVQVKPHPVGDRRLGRIVHLLTGHATVVMSGTKIAEEIGSTRSEVWRLIQQLRGLGVDVAGHPATGYQLRAVPDILLPEFIQPLVRGTIFEAHIHHFYRIGSTNTSAMEAAAAGAPEGSVFFAEEQVAGRGRGANQWQSPPSTGIYCSVILRPSVPPSEVLVLSLAAGLAVRSAVLGLLPDLAVDLKWPNDLLVGDRKFCGILTEMNAEVMRVRHVVVGIGINVNQDEFPAELADVATSLRIAAGKEVSRVALAAALLKSLDHEVGALFRGMPPRHEVLRRFTDASSWLRGTKVRIDDSGAVVEGTTEGLDDRGFLLVRTRYGMQTVMSGTVRKAE